MCRRRPSRTRGSRRSTTHDGDIRKAGLELTCPATSIRGGRRGEAVCRDRARGRRLEVTISFFRWSHRRDRRARAATRWSRRLERVSRARHPRADRGVISDFGGVLTNRLIEAFAAFQDETGISTEQLGRGMQRVAERDGEYPLFRLERGEVTEQAVPRRPRRGGSRTSSATAPRCTASARSTSRRCTPTSRCST